MSKITTTVMALITSCLIGCQLQRPEQYHDECAVSRRPSNGDATVSEATIRELKIKARRGDGAAAFKLFWFYAGDGANLKEMAKYLAIAVRLENPDALYYKAFMIWTRERNPDVDMVKSIITSAFNHGCQEDRGLLDEVLAASQTGRIPMESRYRSFSDASEPTSQP